MENSIKELIELSTSSGAIKQESRDFIYQKAEEKGISKTECDIYIENALNVITKQDGVIKTEKSYRGWWFILIGIGDFIWGASCMGNSYTEGMGVFGLISGALFILVGTFLLGWLNVKTLKKIFTQAQKFRPVVWLILDYSVLIYFTISILIPITVHDFSNFYLWERVSFVLFWGGVPLLLAFYKGYQKTKSVLIGNLAFWLLVIILPHNSENSFLFYARETFNSISPFYLFIFKTICLAGFVSDYLQSKANNIEVINKIAILFKPMLLVIDKLNILFKPMLLSLAIIIPFVCLTLFSTFTKHKVTSEELDTFTEKNTAYIGYWYFLNTDSTKLNTLQISSQVNISSDEKGDIELVLTASFDENNTIKLNKHESELKLKENYSFQIKYPIVFENIFEITTYENNILKGVLTSATAKKMAIIASRESSGFEEAIRKKQESIERLKNQVEFNNTFNQGTFTVISDKCYFYSEPSIENRRNAYLVKGQSGSFNKVVNEFVFVSYTNADGITTEGWFNKSDIELQ